MKYHIQINTTIGDYIYHEGQYLPMANYVAAVLAKYPDQEVHVRLESLGGNLSQAISISKHFEDHGNVTVHFIGFNASASTYLSLGAKKRVAYTDTFYLIHKPLAKIDLYGAYNEDDLEVLIEDLKKKSNENQLITLQMAQRYHQTSGQSIKDIIDLMTQDTWIGADTAYQKGFVDQVVSRSMANSINPADVSNMLNSFNLPTQGLPNNNMDEPSKLYAFFASIQSQISDFFNNHKTKNIIMEKKWNHINSVTQTTEIAVTNNKVALTTAQMDSINDTFEESANTISNLTNSLTAEREAHQKVKDELEALKNADGTSNDRQFSGVSSSGQLDIVATMAKAKELHNLVK